MFCLRALNDDRTTFGEDTIPLSSPWKLMYCPGICRGGFFIRHYAPSPSSAHRDKAQIQQNTEWHHFSVAAAVGRAVLGADIVRRGLLVPFGLVKARAWQTRKKERKKKRKKGRKKRREGQKVKEERKGKKGRKK